MTEKNYPIVTEFSNRYGQLQLSLVTDFVPVSTIHTRDIADVYKFDVDTAERIALITENRRIQLFCGFNTDKRWAIVVHSSPSMAAVVRITHINYTGPDAQREIETLNRLQCPAIFGGV